MNAAALANEIYCANIRATCQFAVADANESWYDLTRKAAPDLLEGKTLEVSR
ncbi:hypothetical protein [Desulfoferrobacter suflitae]|uniref:hypothetical protein n=1 Tax=Desulfoferrobacter suflitae TaxID=2865782 RepID=UPI002164BB77|nr:hypothetical protein [Desulfoferrobacter suflitae]MCK8600960.1 hypothetical protein [Desulfoferrobacter suflitae]